MPSDASPSDPADGGCRSRVENPTALPRRTWSAALAATPDRRLKGRTYRTIVGKAARREPLHRRRFDDLPRSGMAVSGSARRQRARMVMARLRRR